MKNWESTLQWLPTYLQWNIARTTSEAVFTYSGAIKVFVWNDDQNVTRSMQKWMMSNWVFFSIGGRESLKCLGRMIRSLYNNDQDPELDRCVGELYRMSMVCFLRTTLTPPGMFSVSPFLKDKCTSDFPNWAFNLKEKIHNSHLENSLVTNTCINLL